MATADSQELALDVSSLTGLHWVSIVAAVVSGAVHLLLGIRMFPSLLGMSFILAGVGLLQGVMLVLIDFQRRAVYAVGIPFIMFQILLWYYYNFVALGKSFPADVGTLGAVDKVAQVVLLAVLVALLRNGE